MSKIAVVAGSGPGMGMFVAGELARNGYDVALLSSDIERLAGASEAVRSHGRRALAIPTDLADQNEMKRVIAQIERELGPIDIWLNTAGAVIWSEQSASD
jgi:NADP-dependent 3-hydroxy acid dehydrogenase YdfG